MSHFKTLILIVILACAPIVLATPLDGEIHEIEATKKALENARKSGNTRRIQVLEDQLAHRQRHLEDKIKAAQAAEAEAARQAEAVRRAEAARQAEMERRLAADRQAAAQRRSEWARVNDPAQMDTNEKLLRAQAAEMSQNSAQYVAKFRQRMGVNSSSTPQAANGAQPGDWVRSQSGKSGIYLGKAGDYYFFRAADGVEFRTSTAPKSVVGQFVLSQSGYVGVVKTVTADGYAFVDDGNGKLARTRAEGLNFEVESFKDLKPGGMYSAQGSTLKERILKVFSDGRILSETGRIFSRFARSGLNGLGAIGLPLGALGVMAEKIDAEEMDKLAKGKCPSDRVSTDQAAQWMHTLPYDKINTILTDCQNQSPDLASRLKDSLDKHALANKELVSQHLAEPATCSALKSESDGRRRFDVKFKDGLTGRYIFDGKGQLTTIDVRPDGGFDKKVVDKAFTLQFTDEEQTVVYRADGKTSAQEESMQDFAVRLSCLDQALATYGGCGPGTRFPQPLSDSGLNGLSASSRHKPFADWDTEFIKKAASRAVALRKNLWKHRGSSNQLDSLCTELAGSSSGGDEKVLSPSTVSSIAR